MRGGRRAEWLGAPDDARVIGRRTKFWRLHRVTYCLQVRGGRVMVRFGVTFGIFMGKMNRLSGCSTSSAKAFRGANASET